MELSTNVDHNFDLSDMKVGDIFMGCRKCGWRLNPGEVGYPECPECQGPAFIYKVTEDDAFALTNKETDNEKISTTQGHDIFP